MRLREYQDEAVKSIQKNLKQGIHRQLVVLPTGSGKTIIFAAIAQTINKKTLVLAHRNELIQQAHNKIQSFWPEASIGICKAKDNDLEKQIVVGSVQTCIQPKRLQQLKEQEFEVLIIDEAHHAAADSYQRIIKELGFDCGNKLLIGATATPSRGDSRGLGDTFQKIVFTTPITKLIKLGYLSRVKGRRISTDICLKEIRTRAGDFEVEQLSQAINIPQRNKLIVDKFIQHAATRKTIVFTADIKHAVDLAGAFVERGVSAVAIWGTMKQHDRQSILAQFSQGTVQVLLSCNLLTEGFDEPSVNCVIMARPTKSTALYTQMVGRGLRIDANKTDCLVLDFTDKAHILKNIIILTNAIPGCEYDIDKKAKPKKTSPRKVPHQGVTISNIRDEAFNLLGQKYSPMDSLFMWVDVGDKEWVFVDYQYNHIVVYPYRNGYVASLYANGMEFMQEIVLESCSLEQCIRQCEQFAATYLDMAFARKEGRWNQLPATIGQIRYISKNGLCAKPKTMLQAAYRIKEIIAKKQKQRRTRKSSEAMIPTQQKEHYEQRK